jgi:hypothetical protein
VPSDPSAIFPARVLARKAVLLVEVRSQPCPCVPWPFSVAFPRRFSPRRGLIFIGKEDGKVVLSAWLSPINSRGSPRARPAGEDNFPSLLGALLEEFLKWGPHAATSLQCPYYPWSLESGQLSAASWSTYVYELAWQHYATKAEQLGESQKRPRFKFRK